jgi:4-hydroxyisophthalate hydroxylase
MVSDSLYVNHQTSYNYAPMGKDKHVHSEGLAIGRLYSRVAQIIIVGAGPVGLGLAIELGQRGIRCKIIERNASISMVPKGQNLTQRTMEHFHFWGAEQQLRAARTIPPAYGIGGVTAYETLLGEYSYDWLQRELVRPYYFTDNERLPQYATEKVLRERVAELPALEAWYGWSAEAVGQDEHGVWAEIAGADGIHREVLRAEYLIGCDGSRSNVRQLSGITQSCNSHDKRMALLVFRSVGLNALLEQFPGKSYFNVLHPDLDGYWQFFGRVDLDGTWFFHAPVPPGTTKDNFDFARLLRSAVGAPFEIEVDYIGFWDLRFAVADTYGSGRIFIGGDAAHSHPPYGGYGINTGLEDAANLGWKLAAVLGGWGGPELLNTYTEERKPVFESTAGDFIEKAILKDKAFLRAFDPRRNRAAFEAEWNARRSGAKDEVGTFEPNYEGSSIVWGTPGAKCGARGRHCTDARPGHHLAPLILEPGRNSFTELGDGFCLIECGGEEASCRAFATAARELGIPLKIIAAGMHAGQAYGATLVLVRPDQFVAWTSQCTPAPAHAILARAAGRFTRTDIG